MMIDGRNLTQDFLTTSAPPQTEEISPHYSVSRMTTQTIIGIVFLAALVVAYFVSHSWYHRYMKRKSKKEEIGEVELEVLQIVHPGRPIGQALSQPVRQPHVIHVHVGEAITRENTVTQDIHVQDTSRLLQPD